MLRSNRRHISRRMKILWDLLSGRHHGLTQKLDNLWMQSKWRKVCSESVSASKKIKVKEKVPYSEYEKALRSGKKVVLEHARWVLRQKDPETVRARLGATQVSDKSNSDSYYCPTPKQMSHRLVMSRAWHRRWKCVPGDVTTAFLQADLTGDAEAFIVPPETETGGRKML